MTGHEGYPLADAYGEEDDARLLDVQERRLPGWVWDVIDRIMADVAACDSVSESLAGVTVTLDVDLADVRAAVAFLADASWGEVEDDLREIERDRSEDE